MAEDKDTNATHVLAAAHRKVEDLFERYDNVNGDSQKQADFRRLDANRLCGHWHRDRLQCPV